VPRHPVQLRQMCAPEHRDLGMPHHVKRAPSGAA
jgi:hypothetical protein